MVGRMDISGSAVIIIHLDDRAHAVSGGSRREAALAEIHEMEVRADRAIFEFEAHVSF